MLLPLALLLLAPLPQAERITATLAPGAPDESESLRWSPKGASVPLEKQEGALVGKLALGANDAPAVAVRLEKSAGAERFDVLAIDLDRNGRFDATERLTTTPKETRAKWWSSFDSEIPVPVPEDPATHAPAGRRPYPLSLWFVEDPAEPDAKPALRWTRRGWHEGKVTVDGKPAFVLLNDMELDGRFDQRDAWALARERKGLFTADARSLETHVWLDGRAYRAVAIDPHGRNVSFERFDPGFTEAEEKAKADVYAPDRAAPRAKEPLAFGHDLAAALERAKREKKRVLVDFETTWCGPCKLMDQLVYSAQPVVDAAREVIAVKVDGDEHKDLVKRFQVGGYPTMILLDADGKELRRGSGYHSVAKMVEMLKR
jgi:thiol-disulfide isomerase/thioredoxin